MNRWIMYAHQNISGQVSFRLSAHESLDWCIQSLEQYRRDVCDEVSATLYVFSPEAWELAREYEDVGCPFDYPDKQITRGPRNGWRIENC